MLKLYLDMDGTLVDFVSQVGKYGFWRKDKDNKVDWDKVKAVGPRFWSEMDWMPGAKAAFEKLQQYAAKGRFELFILSSIDFAEGRDGKKQWIKTHTNFPLENVILVQEPEDKAAYAAKDAWLVDDRKKSLEPFKKAGGTTVEFTGNWDEVMGKLEEHGILCLKRSNCVDKNNLISLCWFEEFGLRTHNGTNDGSITNYLDNTISYNRNEVVEYLKNGKKIAFCPKQLEDPISGRKFANSFAVLSDGRYYWIDNLAYFVEKYNIRLPPDFINHCINAKKRY